MASLQQFEWETTSLSEVVKWTEYGGRKFIFRFSNEGTFKNASNYRINFNEEGEHIIPSTIKEFHSEDELDEDMMKRYVLVKKIQEIGKLDIRSLF